MVVAFASLDRKEGVWDSDLAPDKRQWWGDNRVAPNERSALLG